ncbi:MAG: IS21-like element helper ATPase IstB [Candidatus Methylomirabilales bacterium]
MKGKDTKTVLERIRELLSSFRLPTLAREMGPAFVKGERQDALPVLQDVLEMEAKDRHDRRVERLRHASHLPLGKTFDTLERQRLPRPLLQKIEQLAEGDWVENAENVLAFGLPGVGKTHVACALGHALVERGHSVLFTPTFRLVQDLLAAKRDLQLPRALRRLDLFDALVLDDIGYVQQAPEEVEVLFTLMAERYERRSMLITSNLVFSEWDRIFRNPMTTAAAIDRLVHHSVILEFNLPSYRSASATRKADRAGAQPQATPSETESHP